MFLALLFLQDPLEQATSELLRRLDPVGPGARVVEIARTEPGRRALTEAIEDAVYFKLRSVENDPWSRYEEHLFECGPDGTLKVRAERRAEMEGLAARTKASRERFASFQRRLDERIAAWPGDEDLDKRAKEFLAKPESRPALFQRFQEQMGDPPDEALARALRRGADGRLVLRSDWIEAYEERMEALAEVRAGLETRRGDVRLLIERVADEALRKTVNSDFAVTFLAARLARFALEDDQELVERMLEELQIDPDAPDYSKLADEVRAAEALLKEVTPRLEALATAMVDGDGATGTLKRQILNAADRIIFVEEMRTARRDAAFQEQAYFEELREVLIGENGEVLAGLEEFAAAFPADREAFAEIAERCADPAVAGIFSAPEAAAPLWAHFDGLMLEFREAALDRALDVFTKRYLTEAGGKLRWREDRAGRIDRIAGRARAIAAEPKEE